MKPHVLFAIASCCVALVYGGQVVREKTLQYQSGLRGAPNWKGSLYCPMDYAINIETIRITKLCQGVHCNSLVKYKPENVDDIQAKCTSRNTCDVKIWQKSSTDGKDIVIGYSCRSLLEFKLYPDNMVKRFYSENDVSVVTSCSESGRRTRRSGADITRDGPPLPDYSFDDAVVARELLARARVRGYTIENYNPTESNVFRTIIKRTKRHADGKDITLPVYVAAHLTNSSRKSSKDRRGRFSPDVNKYLERCGKRRGENPDDGGHLVAYTLGGSDEPSNLVPMAKDLNRVKGIWFRHEKEIRDFLENHTAGHVTWEVLVVYSIRSEEPYRPVGFVLRYTKYEDSRYQHNGFVRTEAFINENEDFDNDQCTFHLENFFRPAHQQDPSND